MKILVIEQSKDKIQDLSNRIEEAARLTLLKGITVTGGTLREVGAFIPELIFVGQFAVKEFEDIFKRLGAIFPRVPVALLLSSETYISESIELRRLLPVRILAQGDIPQIAQMILDLGHGPQRGRALNKGKVISVTHSRGGVGATSFAVSAADAISRHGKSVVLVDLAVVNPDITRWSSYGILQQTALRKFFIDGQKSGVHVNEMVKSSPFSNLNLSVVGLMESFLMSFKMHVDSPESAASTFEYIERLITVLADEFEFIVADLGNIWGVSALSALSMSTNVFLVTEGTRQSMSRSFENIRRISDESEDPTEFDYRKWTLAVNGSDSGRHASSLYQECEDSVFFSSTPQIWSMPISGKGSDWCTAGYSLYAAGDKNYVGSIDEIVNGTFPDLAF
jgi:cellulose biosynthesis protein BcsQ